MKVRAFIQLVDLDLYTAFSFSFLMLVHIQQRNFIITNVMYMNDYRKITLFSKGFASWVNTVKVIRVRLHITRYAYGSFLSPTAFKKCPIS